MSCSLQVKKANYIRLCELLLHGPDGGKKQVIRYVCTLGFRCRCLL